MSNNYEKIHNSSSNGAKFRTIVIMTLLAFVGGTITAGWVITKYDLFQSAPLAQRPNSADSQNDAPANIQSAADQAIGIDPNLLNNQGISNNNTDNIIGAANPENQNNVVNDQLINERVDSLDDRLSRINAQAQQASGNAGRTESMLIAFAARRAIDSGSALGYVENELRLKFGRSNPSDVTAIIEAGEKPVRLATLQNQLDTTSEKLLTPSSEASTWDTIKKEMSELFVIRKEGSQPPQPERRLARIKTALSNRDVKTAVAEMEAMPGAANATDWIDMAKRYMQVQSALDAIEAAAIALPTNSAAVPTANQIQPQASLRGPDQAPNDFQNRQDSNIQNSNVDNNGPLR